MLSLLLRRKGWDVVYLGANVPLTDLGRNCPNGPANARCLNCPAASYGAAALYEMAQTLAERQIPLGFGGQGVYCRTQTWVRVFPATI